MIYSENILICLALPLILAMFFTKDNARRFVINFLMGMVICLLGAYISGFIAATSGYGIENTAIFMSPVVEETMKFLPLLFYFIMFEPDNDKLFNAAVGIGTGFASYENVCNMISAGTESLSFLLIRGLAVGVMHIVSVFALTLGLAISRKYKVSGLSTLVGALSVSMLFHGSYNLLASGSGPVLIVAFSLPPVTALILLYAYNRMQEPV